MISGKNKLTITELYKGMRVKASQLSEIYDTYIILTDVEQLSNGDSLGTIAFMDKTLSSEASSLFVDGARICPIYKEKDYYEGDVAYDE